MSLAGAPPGRHHVPMRRALRILSIALITAGIVVMADVAATLLWKEPVSTVYGSIQQSRADGELSELNEAFAADADVVELLDQIRSGAQGAELSPADSKRLAGLFAKKIETGEAIGRIEIPAMDQDDVMLQGTDDATLREGPGHYPDTALPGEGKTIGVAGHRTTYLAPFRRINELEKGDEIRVEMPYGNFTYEVEKTEIVDPYDVEVVDNVGYERIVLTACHPLYSAAQRYVAFGRLTSATPRG
ncbi:class E sortase [Thermoleophilia bacterium SCSIO 60948]|nr:class E sortase [Thermoleophilia bacterium SCSIO 60948]